MHEMRCDDAVKYLTRSDVARTNDGYASDVAKGCQRVTAAIAVDKDDDLGVELHWQDEDDRALAPMILDTVVKARAQLEKDIGVDWPRPTRILVVRDLLSLAATTGIPYKDATTTGTVAIAKWGRVTILSPRASKHGYAWRDTLAHEMTHLAVTRVTVDRAPLWLQEGIAKREETRWRAPEPFDGRPSPESIVARGMEAHLDRSLDNLGQSIAMLPSADEAAVAFAEVTSFVRYYCEVVGPSALPRLLRAIREERDPDAALRDVTGADFKAWDQKWRAWLAQQPKEPLPETWQLGGGRGADPKLDLRDVRDRVRLAELLFGRDHAKSANVELEGLPSAAWSDASIRYIRARAIEAIASGDFHAIESALGEPKDVSSAFGPWWAMRGRVARAIADDAAASSFFFESTAQDPYAVEAACESLESGLFAQQSQRPRPVRRGPQMERAGPREGLSGPRTSAECKA